MTPLRNKNWASYNKANDQKIARRVIARTAIQRITRRQRLAISSAAQTHTRVAPSTAANIACRNFSLSGGDSVTRLHPLYSEIPLLKATLKPSTLRDYNEALGRFLSCTNAENQSPSNLDHSLASYIQSMYFEDPSPGSRQKAVNTIAAVCHSNPHFRSLLPLSRMAPKGWNKKHKPKPATPLTRELLFAFIGAMLESQETEAAVCLLLSWAGLSRASEVIALRKNDTALPGDARMGEVKDESLGVLIREAKTGQNQFVPVSDPAATSVISFYIQTNIANAYLMKRGYSI